MPGTCRRHLTALLAILLLAAGACGEAGKMHSQGVRSDALTMASGWFDLDQDAIDSSRVSHFFTVPGTGTTHLQLLQTCRGVPVHQAVADLHLGPAGELMSVASRFVTGRFDCRAPAPDPDISSDDALAAVTSRAEGIRVQLRYLPQDDGLRLVWWLFFTDPGSGRQTQAMVDARDATVLFLEDMTAPFISWEYHAYGLGTFDPDDPSPGWQVHLDPHDPQLHPGGWHLHPDANNLSGRQVEMKLWTWGSNPVHLNGTAQGDRLVFGFDSADTPEAAAANAFHLVNRGLELATRHGFTQEAGGFDQLSPDPDRILGRIQTDFGSPGCSRTVDGVSASMHLPAQTADGNQHQAGLINELVLHELFGHCVGARILGGKEVVWTGDMALAREEALGDWFGLTLSRGSEDSAHDPRRITDYYLEGTGEGECRKRPYPYRVDNPADLHFGRFDQPPAHYCGFRPTHFNGMILASALWDLVWLLDDTQLVLELVFETMRSLPFSDSFLDFRDQLLTVDQVLHQGDHQSAILEAFRRRGMGHSACDPHHQLNFCDSHTPAFDLPPEVQSGLRPWFAAAHDDSRVQNNLPWKYAAGYHFSVRQPVLLTGLCAYSRSPRTVKLFETGLGRPLARARVPASLWTWSCTRSDRPVSLRPGRLYTVAGFHDQTYGAAIQEGGFSFPVTRDGITIHASTYRYLATGNEVPVNWVTDPVMYGLVDVQLSQDR